MTEFPAGLWQVDAWAPGLGDFPGDQHLIHRCDAQGVNDAIRQARSYWRQWGYAPTIVAARREPLNPPWIKESA